MALPGVTMVFVTQGHRYAEGITLRRYATLRLRYGYARRPFHRYAGRYAGRYACRPVALGLLCAYCMQAGAECKRGVTCKLERWQVASHLHE
jgi:hypothetical protein